MGNNLFTAFNCHIEVNNTELSNAGGGIAILIGGKYHFIHCTLANFMTLKKRESVCLTIANNANNDIFSVDATFDNCIIDGSFDAGNEMYKGELNLSINEAGSFNYLFNHCILKSMGENNEQFKHVLFTNESPAYRQKGNEKNKYTFDFRPDTTTTLGVGEADIFATQQYPIDRYGINRLTNDGPDIGAYEFVPKENVEK